MTTTPHSPQSTDAPNSTSTAYALLGGDVGVRTLVDRFYDLMDLEPAYQRLRAVHGPQLDSARDKLYLFLTGWLGGPPVYVEKYGHPRLRMRHFPFSIGIVERDQWLACMAQAMEETQVNPRLRVELAGAFYQTADWMRNQAE